MRAIILVVLLLAVGLVSRAAAQAPPQAAAQGYNTRTLGPQVLIGTNWWVNEGGNVTTNPDGSVTLAGPWNANKQIKSGDGHSFGTAFGGGGYFEIDFKWINPLDPNGPNGIGWPGWWANSVEGRDIPSAPNWPAGAAGNGDAIEWDIFEQFSDGWGPTIWDWSANGSIGTTYFFVNGAWWAQGNSRGTGSAAAWSGVRHKIGGLWIPATATTQGRTEYYMDGVLQPALTMHWDKWNSSVGLPLVNGTTAGSIMDLQHFAMLAGTGATNPMIVYGIEIWQRDGLSNLPPTSPSLQESVEGTTVTTAGPTITASATPGVAAPSGPFTIFALNGTGGILRNGVFDSVTANVISLVYHNHATYQNTSCCGWYIDTGGVNGWAATTAPATSTSNLIADLSKAGTNPVTGLPAAKIAYSIHLSPLNVAGSMPDTPLVNVTPIWNTYFGNLVKNGTAPVLNLSTGCSCDGSNGQLTDDQAFMGNWVAYANGLASGGPAFTGAQQPMGNAWYSWGNFSENPNGTLNSDSTLKGASTGQAGGQAFYWSQLLYTASAPVVPPQTVWNGLDKSAGITLSNSNLTATTTVASSQSVRATTSKSSGKACFAVTAGTITTGWTIGLANSGYNLTAAGGLGGDTAGIGFDPNKVAALQGIFYGNVNLSSGAATSANGENAMVCADFTASLFWATDSAMRTAVGSGVWNSTVGCDPTSAACGKSFSGLTCPCFPTYNNLQTGSAATLATTTATMPFALPANFNPWDLPLPTGHPIIMIFGDNDNQPRPSNDNRPRLALLERRSQ